MSKHTVTEEDFEALLLDQLSGAYAAATFREAGVITLNKGLVLRTQSGEEFRLTIRKEGGSF